MYGLILENFASSIRERYGMDKWLEVRKRAEIVEQTFVVGDGASHIKWAIWVSTGGQSVLGGSHVQNHMGGARCTRVEHGTVDGGDRPRLLRIYPTIRLPKGGCAGVSHRAVKRLRCYASSVAPSPNFSMVSTNCMSISVFPSAHSNRRHSTVRIKVVPV
jgi:hypothetical protein